jgi:hypothetical protein
LEALWKNDKSSKDSIIDRIKKNVNQASSSKQYLFTEESMAEEYYKAWL